MNTLSCQILRFSIAFLLLWFGWQQFFNAEAWLVFLPAWTGYLPIPGETLVQINGWFEIMAGIFLIIGVYTRVIAWVVGIKLIIMAAEIGGAIGVRDAVLGVVILALALAEPDKWTLDFCQSKTALANKND